MTNEREPVIGVRLDPIFIARLDTLAVHLSRKADGAKITRSDALRIAATRGLDAYAPEMEAMTTPSQQEATRPAKAEKGGKPARKPK